MEFFTSIELGSNSSKVFHTRSSLMEMLDVGNSLPPSRSMPETTAKSIAACKNHSEAERRRRKGINGHLSTLRTLLPNTIKTDKASLLAEVVKCVKELKETTTELAVASSIDTNAGSSCRYNRRGAEHEYIVPSETDELMLYYCDKYYGTIKATVSCYDRPELMQDLTRALNSVQAKVVRAEMATVGGRTKMVLWVQSFNGDARALKVVIDRAASLSDSGQAIGKRPRFSQY